MAILVPNDKGVFGVVDPSTTEAYIILTEIIVRIVRSAFTEGIHLNGKVLDIVESDACLVEVWKYSPKLFAKKGVVDRFSLFLSIGEDNDERVQSAIEGMMEQIEW